MRRKVYTKNRTLRVAYDVVAKEGFKGFTAGDIAKKIGVSTQPIYLKFENMKGLKNTLLDPIFEQLEEDIFPTKRTSDKIIDLGLNYIYSAKKHHSPHMVLHIDGHRDGKKVHDSSYSYFREVIREDERYNQLSGGYIDALYTGIWIAVTGLASLMSSNIMHSAEEQVIALIERTTDSILALDNPEIIRQCSIMMDLIGKSVGCELSAGSSCRKAVSVIYLLEMGLASRGKSLKIVLTKGWQSSNVPGSRSGEPQ